MAGLTTAPYKILAVVILLLACIACKKDEPGGSNKDPFASFDRKAMLHNMVSNVIQPSYQNFTIQLDSLALAWNAFENSNSAENLSQVQQAWLNASLAWKACEIYRTGPTNEAKDAVLEKIDYASINQGAIENSINTTALENAISSAIAIDEAYVDRQLANAQGLPTLEYLLYATVDGQTVLQILSKTENTNRRKYIDAAIKSLQTKANGINTEWKAYTEEFSNADGRDIGSSIGMVSNNMVYFIEILKNEKTGRPLGKRNGGSQQPQAVEARYSNKSWEQISANLKALQYIFEGRSSQGDLSGFDDLLDQLEADFNGAPLSQVIETQFNTTIAKVDAMNIPLQQALTQKPEAVEDIYNELKKLVVLTKVDMVTNLGIVLTYQDNDGD